MAEDRQSGGGFIGRWSRMKRKAGRAPERDVEPEQPFADDRVSDEKLEELAARADSQDLTAEEQEMLANREAAEAVDIETLGYDSDFSLFLKRGVPAALRRKAMRKLWASSPVLANLDGLNDYDIDYADPSFNQFTSIWQVGRGFLTDKDKERPAPMAQSGARGTEGLAAQETLPETENASHEACRLEPAESAETVAAGGTASPESGSVEASGDAPPPDLPDTADRAEEIGARSRPVRVSLRRRVFGESG